MKYKEVNLGELVSFVSKGIPPKYIETKSDNTIVVLNQRTNRNFQIDYSLSRLNDLLKKKVPTNKILIDYDILINSTGVGTAGRVAQLVKVPELTTVDGHMIIVRPDEEKIDPLYLGYALKAQQVKIEGLQEGSTGQTELNRQRLLNDIIIKFPESRKLQQDISRLFFSLDEKIENNKKINHHLEQIGTTIWQEKFNDKIPNGTLGDIAIISSGKRPPVKTTVPTDEEKIPILGASSVMGYTNQALYHQKILVTGRVGTHGIIQRYQRSCWPSDNTLVLQSNSYEFVYQILKNIDFTVMNRGSTQPLITQTDLKKSNIYIPTTNELSDFEIIVGAHMKQYEQNNIENDILSTLRDTLLPKLLSGEISINQATK
ncbi:restriction endonuclease subunit S [Streptococcus sanguinis]|uniref:Restriction endonuclease subunit S n=1 Tax=Streptococcus sanguinis TaxID=1305 RepID=A0A3P1S6P9_STRSA|nr:restriction endonuclease subunit S [Streptococcus sanguinis]RRC92547.1 restriction endonuclease subunit S [Streptococcus sanguinis]